MISPMRGQKCFQPLAVTLLSEQIHDTLNQYLLCTDILPIFCTEYDLRVNQGWSCLYQGQIYCQSPTLNMIFVLTNVGCVYTEDRLTANVLH